MAKIMMEHPPTSQLQFAEIQKENPDPLKPIGHCLKINLESRWMRKLMFRKKRVRARVRGEVIFRNRASP